jgi:hypothetical protein
MIGNITTANDQAMLNKASIDKFQMFFDIPPLLRNINKRFERKNTTISLDTMAFSIYGAVVPAIIVPSIDLNYSGSPFSVTSMSHPKYEPLTVNFTVDNMFNNYWVIYSWLNALREAKEGTYATSLNCTNNNLTNGTLREYSTDINIVGKDEFNNDVIKWIYKSAFPTTLNGISYNHREASEIESSFTFAFSELYCLLI